MPIKEKIIELLEGMDINALKEMYFKDPSVLRRLIALTYDRDSTLCWRAIEAIGEVSAEMSAEEARRLLQRLLWMMRDESGGNPWSAPDIIGEIIRAHIDSLSDVIPVVASFHDEEIFRKGVLRAIGRIAEKRADLCQPFGELLAGYLRHPEPEVRGAALFALGALSSDGKWRQAIESCLNDKAEINFYIDGMLRRITVSEIAEQALKTQT